MSSVKRFTSLDERETGFLDDFTEENFQRCTPYHTIGFARVMDEVFGYENLSLVAFGDTGEVIGYLPQWLDRNAVVSVPWRDRGGPVCSDDRIVPTLVEETKKMVRERRLKGFMWKAFKTESLDNEEYFVNVEINLSKYTVDSYWKSISSKVRGKVKAAERNGLEFRVEDNCDKETIEVFYRLFLANRKRLGVPTYPLKLFESYVRNMASRWMRLFVAYKDDTVLSSMILLHDQRRAIDAYSACGQEGLELKANDFLLYNVIAHCIKHGIKTFDFGADSPLQQSLIDYKTKWLGEKKRIATSFFGNVREIDHNKPAYGILRYLVRGMPMWMYLRLSGAVVR